jgi:hypothetical protein
MVAAGPTGPRTASSRRQWTAPFCNGQQGVGGEACLTGEDAGDLGSHRRRRGPRRGVVGELGGEVAGLRDFGVVELGGTNEGADDSLKVDAREAEPVGLGQRRRLFVQITGCNRSSSSSARMIRSLHSVGIVKAA